MTPAPGFPAETTPPAFPLKLNQNSPAKSRAFSQYVGQRCGKLANAMWSLGDDNEKTRHAFTPPEEGNGVLVLDDATDNLPSPGTAASGSPFSP